MVARLGVGWSIVTRWRPRRRRIGMGFIGGNVRVRKGKRMTEVVVTVELEAEVYVRLLNAANEVGVPVSEYAEGLIANYLEDNYGEV
jgi:hypothetical protein